MSEPITRRRFLVAGASVLAVGAAALVGGTYAKYVRKGEANDDARVAAFGVSVDTNGSLFAKTYSTTDTTAKDAISYSVVSSSSKSAETNAENDNENTEDDEGADDNNVVAPGTGSSLTFILGGTPEVAVRVTLALAGGAENSTGPTDVYLEKSGEGDVDYHPLKYTLSVKTPAGSTATAISAKVDSSDENPTNASGVSLETLTAMLKNYSLDIGPNIDLSGYSYILSWEWPIGTGDTDEKDTILGNLQAGKYTDTYTADGGNYGLTCDVKVTLTVTQID